MTGGEPGHRVRSSEATKSSLVLRKEVAWSSSTGAAGGMVATKTTRLVMSKPEPKAATEAMVLHLPAGRRQGVERRRRRRWWR